MNILSVNFEELYRRHLCRHAQFGLNLLHVVAVVGIYVSLIGVVDALLFAVRDEAHVGILLGLMTPYFLVLLVNIPLKVWIPTVLFMLTVLVGYRALPPVPVWIWLLLIPTLHQFQQISHKWYPLSRDMSDFQAKYRKGFVLFLLLTVYELPILLNYLLYGKRDWVK